MNTGGATCTNVQELIEIVRQEVREKTGIEMECEVIPVGEGQPGAEG